MVDDVWNSYEPRPPQVLNSLINGTAIAMFTVGALLLAGTTPAHATPLQEVGVSSSAIGLENYSYEEIVAATAGSPGITVTREPEELRPGANTRGVSFGVYVYVQLSQSQARAIPYGNAALAVGIIGLAAGPIAGAIAGAVYAYIASIGSDGRNRYRNWEFRLAYTGQIVGAKCV